MLLFSDLVKIFDIGGDSQKDFYKTNMLVFDVNLYVS